MIVGLLDYGRNHNHDYFVVSIEITITDIMHLKKVSLTFRFNYKMSKTIDIIYGKCLYCNI